MDKTVKNEQPKKGVLKMVGKISAIVGLSIVGLFCLIFAGGNSLKYLYYHEFISLRKNIATIPGLNTGAVPQGITYYDGGFIMSMYMKNTKSPSRIYVMDKNKKSHFVELYEDANFTTPCTRHCGGIQYIKKFNKVVVADANRFMFELDINDLVNSNNKKLQIKNINPIDNEASSIFSNDNAVYVSEFNKDGSAWVTQESHILEHNNEKHKSYIAKFDITNKNDLTFTDTEIDCYYSIPDLVQGVAFKDRFLYTSTSWGLSSSHITKYDLSKCDKITNGYKNKDVYFVNKNAEVKSLKCPPMFEDLDIATIDGEERLITYNESASNKYIFGKFFFNDKIVGVKLF